MNISFLVGNYYPRLGGMEQASFLLANALETIPEVSVSVACGNLSEVLYDYAYPHKVYRSKKFWYFTPYLQKRNRIRMIRKEHTNILHGHILSGGGSMGLALKKKYKLPLVVTSHGSDVQVVPEIGYGECLQPKQKLKVKQVLQEADRLIALSHINFDDMLSLGADANKISIIPNGVPWQSIQNIPQQSIRARLGISKDCFVLLTVGRNKPVKRLSLIFDAIALLKDLNLKCLCVGPSQHLKELARIKNIEDKIICTGIIPENQGNMYPPFADLVNVYRAADLYISASYRESFGIAAAEAMACGTPVLVGQKHGVRDVVQEGVSGFTMRGENPEDLAVQIREIAATKVNPEKIKLSVKKLDWKNVADMTYNLYQSLL